MDNSTVEIPSITLGQVAYTAYGQVTDFKNYQGLPMPKWEELTEKIREAWEAAAIAVQPKGIYVASKSSS